MTTFTQRLTARISRENTRVVVGIDPVAPRLPAALLKNTGEAAEAIRESLHAFGRLVVEAVHPYVAAVKFQIAFYEQWGIPGLQALEETIRGMTGAGLPIILDAKRGDIGSVAQAYAAAYLGGGLAEDGPSPQAWAVDALTVNPYLGEDSLEPLVEAAAQHHRGLFILVKTSNPGSGSVQDLRLAEGGTVAEKVAELVSRLGEPWRDVTGYSPIGAVVGATYPERLVKLRRLLPHAYLLLPGYGAQGAGARDIVGAFDEQGNGALVSASRSVIYAGHRQATLGEVAGAMAAAARQFRDEVNEALERRRPGGPST